MSDVAANNPGFGALHEIVGRFDSSDRMDDAIGRLELAGFARAELSLPEPSPPVERSTPDSGAKPPYTDDDAQSARTLHASGAATVAALAAAGVTVGTGGAAAPAFAAAVGAGALAGGATFVVTKASDDQEQRDRDARASAGALLLSVRAPDAARQAEAEGIMRSAGALEVRAAED